MEEKIEKKRLKKDKEEIALPELIVLRDEATKQIESRIKKGEELKSTQISNEVELKNVRLEFKKWDSYNIELLSRVFTNSKMADEYKVFHGKVISMYSTFADKIRYLYDDIDVYKSRLEGILGKLNLIPEHHEITESLTEKSQFDFGSEVFIVHGHDNEVKETVARFLEKLDLIPVILHEKPNAGRTLIEKFIENSRVGFSVILISPDDVGAPKDESEKLRNRARQNVILELGYFLGFLGRERVCVLYKADVELPSDWEGVLYIPYDEQGAWKFLLAKEIRHAGLKIDLNKVV